MHHPVSYVNVTPSLIRSISFTKSSSTRALSPKTSIPQATTDYHDYGRAYVRSTFSFFEYTDFVPMSPRIVIGIELSVGFLIYVSNHIFSTYGSSRSARATISTSSLLYTTRQP